MCVLNSAYHSFFSLLLQGIWILTPLIKLIIHHEDGYFQNENWEGMLTFKWKETCDCIFLIQISIKHWKRWNQLYKSVNINIMCKVSFFENLMFEDISVQSRITQILSQKKRKYNSFAIFVDFKYWDTKY